MTVKFTFYLKNGRVFDTVEVLTKEQLNSIINTVNLAMQEDLSARILFSSSVVRVSECAVVEWEELDEPETEKS